MKEDNFYFDRLPKFINILKQSLKDKLNKNNYLTIKDHIEVFCNFYEKNNVCHYFADLNIKADVMYIAVIRNEFENSIHIERKIRIEDDDDQYQIQLKLSFESISLKIK